MLLYATSRADGGPDEYILHALRAIGPFGRMTAVVVPRGADASQQELFADVADQVLVSPYAEFDARAYPWAVRALRARGERFSEVVLTGDSWFGPMRDMGPVLDRMDARSVQLWAMVENAQGEPESFPNAGFPHRVDPWLWTVVGRDVFESAEWSLYWDAQRSAAGLAAQEREFITHFARRGYSSAFAFPAADYSSADPALYASALLLDDGCPMLDRAVFTLYPPFLDRFAVIGREILRHVEDLGFPMPLIWQNLARTIAPKSLYAVGGMLEVLPDVATTYDAARPFRIAAILHVAEVGRVQELLERLAYLPGPYDLYLTTSDGKRAAEIQRMVEERADPRLRQFDVRVTPASRGRDMSDFFVGCRDVLLNSEYDLVIKLHARRMSGKTVNVTRYFRRYQYENLLNSPGYVANLLALFQREPGLGFVFPPMMHIGYSTMGRGWSDLQHRAKELSERIGIHVPQDRVSPLAPYGGMFVCRPEALVLLSGQRLRYGDYGRLGTQRYKDLAHLQERMIVSAGAELGYHSRAVLTSEHAAISHTALESKVDHLFSTTRGWPVEQIQLLQKAGYTGHGGVVALSRMYVRLNHPRASRVLVPLYAIALRGFVALRLARDGIRELTAALLGTPGKADS